MLHDQKIFRCISPWPGPDVCYEEKINWSAITTSWQAHIGAIACRSSQRKGHALSVCTRFLEEPAIC